VDFLLLQYFAGMLAVSIRILLAPLCLLGIGVAITHMPFVNTHLKLAVAFTYLLAVCAWSWLSAPLAIRALAATQLKYFLPRSR
jgi:hypothetical protein